MQSAPEKLAPVKLKLATRFTPELAIDVFLLLLAMGVLTAAALLTLGGPEQVLLPWVEWVIPGTCTLKVTMGVGCPGCGLTRCFIAMAHGNLAAAAAFNPIGVLMFTLLAAQVPYRGWKLWQAWQGKSPAYNPDSQMRWTLWILGTVILLLVVQWFIRLSLGNVP